MSFLSRQKLHSLLGKLSQINGGFKQFLYGALIAIKQLRVVGYLFFQSFPTEYLDRPLTIGL